MKKTREHKARTISDSKFQLGAKYVDAALLPVIKTILDKANQELSTQGIRVHADIQWGFDEVASTTEGSDQ